MARHIAISCLVFLCFIFRALPQPRTAYSFIRVDASQGLVNNQVTCLFKDSRGFTWIGTSSGLSRFDGLNFVNYRHNDKDSSSLPDNYIESIQEDGNRRLWIATRWEYTVFDLDREIFIRDISCILKEYGLEEPVDRVYIDRHKQLWFRPQGKNQFFTFSPENKSLISPYQSVSSKTTGISDLFHDGKHYYFLYTNGTIECFEGISYRLVSSVQIPDMHNTANDYPNKIFADNEGDYWIYGNNNGLKHFNKKLQQWKHYSANSKEIKLSSNLVKKIVQGPDRNIWVGTDHGGIDIIDRRTGKLTPLFFHTDDPKSIPQNSITDILVDQYQVVWISTFKRGIAYYHQSIHKFPHLHAMPSDKKGLPFNDINCFAEDYQGNLWIGTNGGGLIFYNRSRNEYKVYTHDPKNPKSLSNNVVVSLFIDDQGLLWIGTFTGGLNVFDGKNFTHYQLEDGNGLPNNNIWTVNQDSQKRLWIGTLGSGIVLFDKKSRKFLPVPNQGSIQLPSPFVNHIHRMKDGNMFIATGIGIAFYDIRENRYRYHPHKNTQNQLTVSNNNVNSVYQDSWGLLWVATREGLTMIDPKNDYLKHFDEEDGLPRDIINCIQEDEARTVWISKSTGISRIEVISQNKDGEYSYKISHYTKAEGLQGQEFNMNASLKTRDGEIIFGGPNGFNLFKVNNIKYNNHLPRVVFTGLQVFNKPIKPGDQLDNIKILEKSITSTESVVLKHSMNVFSIEFAALNSFIPSKSKFRYMLEGFDQDWFETDGNRGKIIYTNLSPGTYLFKVKACNNDGLWNEDFSSLTVTILPPFYATSFAWLIYFVLFALLILYFRYSMLRKARNRFRLEKERLMAKRNHELDETKLRFLTNVSHEFRTPLTLILAPLDQLLKKETAEDKRKLLGTIQRNARNLLDLVNQLLDFRKLDLYGLKFQPSFGDIIAFLKEVCVHFNESFQRKGIYFEFNPALDELPCEFDSKKLHRVLMNLLSNALKFTPPGGKVIVSAELIPSPDSAKENLIIRVKDTGPGIAEADLDKIFDRFYQSPKNQALGIAGSGIGLNLAKEMVHIHGGTIRVNSELGKGSEFVVSIPLGLAAGKPTLPDDGKTSDKFEETKISENKNGENKPTIVLIEDNLDFRSFMRDSLSGKYQIYEAGNGKEGFETIHKSIPDLIISDIMMPQMDGIEMCIKLKKDIRTSHIPVILLTARTADEDKIKGLETGADDYITKPFQMDLLLLRIQNLLEKRREIQKRFLKNIDLSPSEVEITSMDEKLIRKAIKFVEKNIAEPGFSVIDLSRELGMSRVYLYKKLLAITGKSPVEFIRIIRLKRGIQLLEKSQMSVSEVAYKVGFNSPRYFSKYFKEEYGMFPKEYIRKSGQNSNKKIDIE